MTSRPASALQQQMLADFQWSKWNDLNRSVIEISAIAGAIDAAGHMAHQYYLETDKGARFSEKAKRWANACLKRPRQDVAKDWERLGHDDADAAFRYLVTEAAVIPAQLWDGSVEDWLFPALERIANGEIALPRGGTEASELDNLTEIIASAFVELTGRRPSTSNDLWHGDHAPENSFRQFAFEIEKALKRDYPVRVTICSRRRLETVAKLWRTNERGKEMSPIMSHLWLVKPLYPWNDGTYRMEPESPSKRA